MKMSPKLAAVLAAAVMLLSSAVPAYAATDKVEVERVFDISSVVPNTAIAQYTFWDSANMAVMDSQLALITSAGSVSPSDSTFVSALRAWAVNYASSTLGSTLSPSDVIWDGWGQTTSEQTAAIEAAVIPSPATATHTLDSAFQVSTTRPSLVTYSVDAQTSVSSTTADSGTIALQIADDSGFTTGVETVSSAQAGLTGTLSGDTALTFNQSVTLTGFVPAGKYVRLHPVTSSGAPVYTFRSGQETLMF